MKKKKKKKTRSVNQYPGSTPHMHKTERDPSRWEVGTFFSSSFFLFFLSMQRLAGFNSITGQSEQPAAPLHKHRADKKRGSSINKKNYDYMLACV